MEIVKAPQYTAEQIEKATYNELRKMAKEAALGLGRGVTTEEYRKALLEVAEADITPTLPVEEEKAPEAIKKTQDGLVLLSTLNIGDKYTFKSSNKVYEVMERLIEDDLVKKLKVKTEAGTWWESSLNRMVRVLGDVVLPVLVSKPAQVTPVVTGGYVSKSATAKKLWKKGEKIKALGIFSRFKMNVSDEERQIMQVAYEMHSVGDAIYTAMGYDKRDMLAKASLIVETKFLA